MFFSAWFCDKHSKEKHTILGLRNTEYILQEYEDEGTQEIFKAFVFKVIACQKGHSTG